MSLLEKHIDGLERKTEPPITWTHFVDRMFRFGTIALILILVSLLVGIAGYMTLNRLSFVDAFLNASMILGGMGPVAPIVTQSAKIFAGFYALYAGLVFLVVAGLLLAPVVHRVLHRFHWEMAEGSDKPA